jgi:sorting nexin-29
LEKTVEYQVGIHHLFIDFKAAYDSINRKILYSAMEEFGIPLKLVRLVKLTMARVQCLIRVQSHLSNPLEANNGLRQGDALACLLFNIALEKVVRDSGIQTRGAIFYKTVQMLAYADDVDLMSRTMIGLKDSFHSFEKAAKCMGLVIRRQCLCLVVKY